MERERFEQLVSLWLDDPADEGLRAQIEQMIEADPELIGSRQPLEALHAALRTAHPNAMSRVDWKGLRTRIMQSLESSVEDPPAGISAAQTESAPDANEARLDEQLARLPSLDARVDWPRFRERVATQVRKEAARGRVIRFPLRRWTAAAAIVAAAAVILLTAWPKRALDSGQIPTPGPVGETVVKIIAPASTARTPDTFASVRVTAPPAGDMPETSAPTEPEFYLFIGPAGEHDSSLSSAGA